MKKLFVFLTSMLLFLAPLCGSSQAAEPTSLTPAKVSGLLAAYEAAMQKMFDCMDAAMKEELRLNMSDPIPSTMAKVALASCKNVELEMLDASSTMLSQAMDAEAAKDKATNNVAEMLKKIEKVYVDSAEKTLIEPKFADARSKALVNVWLQCVKEKAILWSRLKEDADTIATGALAACNDHRADWKKSLNFWARSQKISLDVADRVSENVEKDMMGTVVALILDERAKSLSKP